MDDESRAPPTAQLDALSRQVQALSAQVSAQSLLLSKALSLLLARTVDPSDARRAAMRAQACTEHGESVFLALGEASRLAAMFDAELQRTCLATAGGVATAAGQASTTTAVVTVPGVNGVDATHAAHNGPEAPPPSYTRDREV